MVRTRRQAGAAGAVAANLVALGVGQVGAIGFCGDDGEGWELRRAMAALGMELSGFLTVPGRFTPTYCKPCYVTADGRRLVVHEELERLDIKNRRPTPPAVQDRLLEQVSEAADVDAMIVVDQVSEAGCGVVTPRLRADLERRARRRGGPVMLADSRARIGRYRNVPIKPNHLEAGAALGRAPARTVRDAGDQARRLSAGGRRPVFLTLSKRGMVVCAGSDPMHVAGFPVDGPVDPVGAGDSTTAALSCCLAAGATPVEAALVANLVGSVTVQQIGTTGTAPPREIRRRWRQVCDGLPTA